MAATAQVVNPTSYAAVLKELYVGQPLEFEAYKNKPFLDLVEKREDFYGHEMPLPVNLSNPGGGSALFVNAQNNQFPSTNVKFNLQQQKQYYVFTIDGPTLRFSEEQVGAFMEARTAEYKAAQYALLRQVNLSLFGTAAGIKGTVLSFTRSGKDKPADTFDQINLSNPTDIVRFETNMSIGTGIPASGSSPATVTARTYTASGSNITGLDRSNGYIFLASGTLVGNQANIAIGDAIFRDGDANNLANGLQQWLPTSAITPGDSFLGVDRSQDTARLAGVAYDGRQDTLSEALVKGIAVIQREGGSPTHAFVSYKRWAELVNIKGSKQFTMDTVPGKVAIGFNAMMVDTPEGQVAILADNGMTDDRCYVLTLSDWFLASAGPLTETINDDGLEAIRVKDADQLEVRLRALYNLGCHAPGRSGVILLA